MAEEPQGWSVMRAVLSKVMRRTIFRERDLRVTVAGVTGDLSRRREEGVCSQQRPAGRIWASACPEGGWWKYRSRRRSRSAATPGSSRTPLRCPEPNLHFPPDPLFGRPSSLHRLLLSLAIMEISQRLWGVAHRGSAVAFSPTYTLDPTAACLLGSSLRSSAGAGTVGGFSYLIYGAPPPVGGTRPVRRIHDRRPRRLSTSSFLSRSAIGSGKFFTTSCGP